MSAPARTAALVALLLAACHPTLEQTFTYSSDGASRTGLAVTSVGVVMGNVAGFVDLVGEDGAQRWRYSLGREIVARPVSAEDWVVVASVGGPWVGLSLQTGSERWRRVERPAVWTPLATDGSTVFVVTGDGSVEAIDPHSGVTRWRQAGLAPPGRTALPMPVVGNGRVMVALGEHGLIALRAADGEPLWTQHALRGISGMELSGDALFVAAEDKLQELSAADGRTRWSASLGAAAVSPPRQAAGAVWVGTSAATLVGVDPSQGTILHRAELPGPAEAPVVESDGLLLIATASEAGRLVAFNPALGRGVASMRVDSPLRSEPVRLGAQWVVSADDGRAVAVVLHPPKRD